MAAPRGAFTRQFVHVPPPRWHGDGNVLAVGWRVVVTSSRRGQRVTLTDSDGTTALSTVPDGAEVEILAWRPRRSGSTLYHVQPTAGGKPGWLSGASLKPRSTPPAVPAAKVQSIAASRTEAPSKGTASKTGKRATKARTAR